MSKHIKCANCGQEFDFDFDRSFVFCEYCGTRIELGDDPNQGSEPAVVTEAQSTGFASEEESGTFAEVQPAQVHPPVAVKEQKAALSEAIGCYNRRDYAGAKSILEELKQSEPENFEVWFCCCKVIAAERPADISAAFKGYNEAAEKCLACAPQNVDVKGNLTLEFNRLIKNVNDTIVSGRLYIAPYDNSVMSELVPSVNYQPLGRVDGYYFLIMDGIKVFKEKVNSNYLTNYFLGLWDTSFFCFAHEITQVMVNDLNSSKFFAWYKADLANRVTNEAVYKAVCDLVYAYKNIFLTLFNRLPYRDTKTTAYNRIAFLNKWLLRLKHTDQYGRTYLLIAQPADRTALDIELRNLKIALSRA